MTGLADVLARLVEGYVALQVATITGVKRPRRSDFVLVN